jgi:hypothetical protein
MDCYAVLGVPRDADQEEIKAAFRARALECHPDRVETDQAAAREEFVRVRKAFEVLSDPQTRAAYDAEAQSESGSTSSPDPDAPARRRSYKQAWRQRRQNGPLTIRQLILDQVGGLSADYETVRGRRSVTVPLCAGLGTLAFMLRPDAIYATDIFLVDLALCTAIGAIYGYVVGSAWGYVDVLLRRRPDES